MRMNVRTIGIDLPDFDQRVAHGVAARVEDFAAEMRHFSNGGRDRIADDEQVVICVARQVIGIEGAFGHCRSPHSPLEFFGEDAGLEEARKSERCSARADTTKESTPRGKRFGQIHDATPDRVDLNDTHVRPMSVGSNRHV